jgi:hypothetical protein
MTKILWKCSDEKLKKSNLFKFENLDRPNRATIYPFSLLILFIFGYLNYRRGKKI